MKLANAALILLLAGTARGANSYFLDAGPVEGLVFSGFVPLTPETSYDSKKGFGWQHKGGQAAVRSGPDALCADFVASASPLLFDVLPDRYIVHVLIGDWGTPREFTDRGTVTIYAEGVARWRRSVSPTRFLNADYALADDWGPGAGKHLWAKYVEPRFADVSFPVTVLDGRLKLRLEFSGGCPVTSVAVFATHDTLRAKAWAAAQEERKRQFLASLRFLPSPPVKERRPGPEAEKRGYEAFVHSYMQPVFPDTCAPGQTKPLELRCFACPGEGEPVAFSLRPLNALKAARVSVTDFVSTEGKVILRDAVNAYRVLYRPVRTAKGYAVMPALLGPDRPVDLGPGITRTYWLRVDVPVGATPGDYKATVTFQSANAPALSMAWKLKVLPVSLADDALPMLGVYYDGPAGFGQTAGTTDAYWRAVESDLAFMRRCGFTAIAPTVPLLRASDVAMAGDKPAVNTARMSRFMALYAKAGFRKPVMAYGAWTTLTSSIAAQLRRTGLVTIERLMPLVREAVGQIQRAGTEEKWPEIILYPTDVAQEKGGIPLYKALKESMPKGVRCAASIGETRETALVPFLDVVLLNADFPMNERLALTLRGGGKALGLSNLGWDRLTWGVYPWRMGAGVRLENNFAARGPDPNNPFDGGRSSTPFGVLPARKGPIPTVWLENAREGIDDFRYLLMLEKTIKSNSPPRDRQLRKVVQRARRLLVRIRRHTASKVGFYLHESGAWEPSAYDKLRLLIARTILQIQRTARKPTAVHAPGERNAP